MSCGRGSAEPRLTAGRGLLGPGPRLETNRADNRLPADGLDGDAEFDESSNGTFGFLTSSFRPPKNLENMVLLRGWNWCDEPALTSTGESGARNALPVPEKRALLAESERALLVCECGRSGVCV